MSTDVFVRVTKKVRSAESFKMSNVEGELVRWTSPPQ